MRLVNALIIAFSTYSRIPMPHVEWSEDNKKYSMCFFPMIGCTVGICVILWIWLCGILKINLFFKGVVATVLPLLITGGIHMDGFMDTLDAMASWQSKERRLEILKDTHTGAFAVIGCSAYLLVSAGAMSELSVTGAAGFTLACIVSRALSALALTCFPKARKNGLLSDFAFSARKKAVTFSCAITVFVCSILMLISNGWSGLFSLIAAGFCVVYYLSLIHI